MPAHARLVLAKAWPTVSRLGLRIACPCCGLRFRSLQPFKGRANARCPWCGSLERHRLLALYLREHTPFLRQPVSLLHVAPEDSVRRVLRRQKGLRYVSIDLHHPLAELRMDVTDLQFPDDEFDAIICSHVLEHIVDDAQAMRELRRVLRPAGLALILVPQDTARETTFEDAAVTSPEERLRVFGQRDHVRIYGRDFEDRLRAAGFSVELDRYGQLLPDAVVRRHALRPHDIYRCMKPAPVSEAVVSGAVEVS